MPDSPADPTPPSADSTDEKSGTGATASGAPATEGGLRGQMSDLMRRLEEAGDADGPDAAPQGGLAAAADLHAEALRATLQAKRDAEEMLSHATKVHSDATVQAERILREAKEVAAGVHAEARTEATRVREEMARWAGERRSTLESDIGGLLEAARREAADLRAEALNKAMPEAEETARRYVAMAVTAGEQDAEALRGEARDLLAQAAEALTRAQERARELGDLLSSHTSRIDEQVTALAGLADAARVRSIGPRDRAASVSSERSTSEDGSSVAVVTETTSLTAVEEGPRGVLPRQRTSPEGGPLGSMFGQQGPDQDPEAR